MGEGKCQRSEGEVCWNLSPLESEGGVRVVEERGVCAEQRRGRSSPLALLSLWSNAVSGAGVSARVCVGCTVINLALKFIIHYFAL